MRCPAHTMASADPCRLSPASRPGLPLLVARRQVSPGKNVDFPCTLAPFTALALDCIGLRCLSPTRPAAQPLMRFVSLKSQVCLRLPPDLASRRRPCPWLTVAAINLRKGLSPSSQRPCWAHGTRCKALRKCLAPGGSRQAPLHPLHRLHRLHRLTGTGQVGNLGH